MIHVVVCEGDRWGLAVCGCGCSFNWDQRDNINVLYKMKDGSLVVFIVCPKCSTSINGPVV